MNLSAVPRRGEFAIRQSSFLPLSAWLYPCIGKGLDSSLDMRAVPAITKICLLVTFINVAAPKMPVVIEFFSASAMRAREVNLGGN